MMVHQHHSKVTDAVLEHPTTFTWLWRRLGVTPELRGVPLASHSGRNFTGPYSSFGASFFGMARHLRTGSTGTVSASAVRCRTALQLPVGNGTGPVSPDEVARFLYDPAVAFLRERVGVRGSFTLEVSNNLSLNAVGLDAWGTRPRLLVAACDE